MDTVDRLGRLAKALHDAAPDEIHLVLRDHLRVDFGATGVELHLADYRQTHLHPVIEPERGGTPVDAAPAGRAYLQQRMLIDSVPGGVEVCAPVTARGGCLGTLAATWQARPELAVQQDFLAVAAMAGHALVVAETATDHYRRLRRRQRMTLAAEIQWQLLPGHGLVGDEFALAGQLEPAYSVRGDNFDWSAEGGFLTVAVTNGMGEGTAAALLTNLGINALRNGRRSGLSLADQAGLANEAVWSQFGGRSHLATVLLRVELASGRVTAVDAGSPHIYRLRGDDPRSRGDIHERLELDQQLPLGMFDSSTYEEQTFDLARGDRLLLLSDGVVDAAREGRRYDTAMARAIRGSRLLPPAGAVRLLLSDLMVFHAGADLADDAVVVCLDWTGKAETAD